MEKVVDFSEKDLLDLVRYGFSELDIQRKLEGEKLISDEVGVWLLEGELLKLGAKENLFLELFLDDFNWEQYHLDENWKQQVMLDYIFCNKDFVISKDKDENLIQVLFELYRIPFVNEFLWKYVLYAINLFYINNFESVSNLFSRYVDLSLKRDFLLDEKIPNLRKEEVVEFVVQYFDEIDLTGNLKRQFLEGMTAGNILLWDRANDEEKRKKYSQDNFLVCDELEVSSTFSFNGQLFVNVLLDGNLEDVFSIVHEFFHKYAFNGENYLDNCEMFLYELEPFSELSSIYFESHLISFLKQKGFSEKEVLASHRYRRLNNFELYAHNTRFVELIKKSIIRREKIVLEDFVCDYSSIIEWIENNYDVMNQEQVQLLSIYQDLNSKKLENAKLGCDNFIKSVMFYSDDYYKSYSYIFDSIIAEYLLQKSDKSVTWMLNFVKDMFYLDMDPYDILSMMLPPSMMFLFQYTYNRGYGNFGRKKDCGIKRLEKKCIKGIDDK